MDNQNSVGKVVIVSFSESFLAKSLITKLGDPGIQSVFVHADIKEIEKYAEEMELIVLFMSEELETVPETLVYLKDIVKDKELGLILIGEDSQYASIKRMIPETAVTDMFKRPLDIDLVVRRISAYFDENTGDKRKKTVLIVDDDITYMRTVYEWLKDTYHVGMASNGVQAISYLAKNRADLILLDYEMPVISGAKVLEMIRSEIKTESIPVMFLTAKNDKESVMNVLALKPEKYLLKTMPPQEWLSNIREFFEKRKDV